MTPVERLNAAFEKLEELRAASTQPTGGKAWIQGRPWRHYEQATEVYTGEMDVDSQDVVHGLPEPADAELICTLHRTIDAQVSILMANRADAEYGREPSLLALNLADAILGGAS